MDTTAPSLKDTRLVLGVECGAAGCALVTVDGELDLYSGPALRQSLGELIASGRTTITLDLTELSFIDSAGHRSLRAVADLAERMGGQVLLGGCSRRVRRFLDLTTGILTSTPLAHAPTRSEGDHAIDRSLVRAVGF